MTLGQVGFSRTAVAQKEWRQEADVQFTTWIEALDRYKQLNPELTDEQIGARLGCSRSATSKARSRASRDELPAHAKLLLIEYLGIQWSRDLALAMLTPAARAKVERALAAAGPLRPAAAILGALPTQARSRAAEFVFNLVPLLQLHSDDVNVVWSQLRLKELMGLLAQFDGTGLALSALQGRTEEIHVPLGGGQGAAAVGTPCSRSAADAQQS